MIIEGEIFIDVSAVKVTQASMHLMQGVELLVIDKQQATQLIAVLQKWVDGGDVE